LKPANIMIGRGGGYAKVVDFGLAMLTDPVTSPDSPTEMKTASGSVIGTTSYMSPEQTEGKEVDARSDIFSFGTILYELLTGNHPFAGTSRVDTMHTIVNRELPADAVPAAFRRIVRRCLAKDPDERYQSMKDVAHDLRDATREIAPAPPARRRAWIAPAIVALILILAGVAWYANNSKTTTSQPPAQPAVTMARITNSGNINSAAISPDGRFVVYAMTDGNNQALWVKQLSTGTATRISEPAPIFIQRTLVSPDANYVYYAASSITNPNIAHLYQIAMLGGEPRRVAADTEFTFTLSPDGKQIAFRRYNAQERKSRLTICDVDNGAERVLLTRDDPAAIDSLTWAPDGASIAYVAGVAGRRDRRIEEIAVNDGTTSTMRSLSGGSTSLVWLHDGTALLACASDVDQPPQVWMMPRSGRPRKITSDVSSYNSVVPTADSQAFAALRGEEPRAFRSCSGTKKGSPRRSLRDWEMTSMRAGCGPAVPAGTSSFSPRESPGSTRITCSTPERSAGSRPSWRCRLPAANRDL
ncbi:MAG: protein kinase domain-containing protein, partial [Thermoanaerobaculia bacterium]